MNHLPRFTFRGLLAAASLLLSFSAALPARAACGDGVVDGTDVCDDGNQTTGDGCNATCGVESGFQCVKQSAVALVNASFELPVTGVSAGWKIATGDVDLVDGTANGGCMPAGDQQFSIDLNGSTRGEIFQDVVTVPGQKYTMTLLGSANCIEVSGDPCSKQCSKILTVSAADVASPTAPFALTTYTLQGGPLPKGWKELRFEFVAPTATTRIRLSGSDPSFAGPMVDRVAFPESVCAPSSCGNGTVEAGEICDDGGATNGNGCSSNCKVVELGWTCPPAGGPCTSTCGDGIKVPSEPCDDGGNTDADGCDSQCKVEPGFVCVVNALDTKSVCTASCGNGTLDPGEACDDSNPQTLDQCSNSCLRGPGETCTVDAQCALGVCVTGKCQGCYDTKTGNGQDFNCAAATPMCVPSVPTATCVECVVDADCAGTAFCRSRVCTKCGNGVLDAGETCDDGNSVDGDGCSTACGTENGFTCSLQTAVPIVNGSFESDFRTIPDGWTVASGSVDFLSSTDASNCWPAGDKTHSLDLNGSTRGEITQDIPTTLGETYTLSFLGSANCTEFSGDVCNNTCEKILTATAAPPGQPPFAMTSYSLQGSALTAGWRRLQFVFVAKGSITQIRFTGSDPSLAGPMIDGVEIVASVCTSTGCGDGTIGAGEACDDGNTLPNDGCSADCRTLEHGYGCTVAGAACTSSCGDGIRVPTEPCDDGNLTPGDGCSATCTVEPGFTCIVDPVAIKSVCGPTPKVDGGTPEGGLGTDGGTPDASTGDASSPLDAGAGGTDGGAGGAIATGGNTAVDAGTGGAAGSAGTGGAGEGPVEAGVPSSGGAAAKPTGGGVAGGACGCDVPGKRPAGALGGLAFALLGLTLGARRRNRARRAA